MSLINDALKKVSKPGNSPAPPPGSPLVPADPPPPDYGKLLLSIFVLIVLVLVAGTFFWWKGKAKDEAAQKTQPATTQSVANAATAPLKRAKTLADNISNQNTEASAIADTISGSDKLPSRSASNVVTTPPPSVTTTQVVATAPAEPQFPDLKISAIYFRFRGPTVVINGKTLYVGDEIDGAKVTQIQRTYAEVEFGGKKKTLTMR